MATTATETTAKTTAAKRTPKAKGTTPERVETFRNSKAGYNRDARVLAWHKRLMPVPTPATVTEAFSSSDPRSRFVALKWDGTDRQERVHFSCVRPIEQERSA